MSYRLTLLEFLQQCVTRNAGRVARIREEFYNADEDLDQVALVEPGLLAAGEPRIEPVVRGGRRGRGVRGRGRALGRRIATAGADNLRRSPSPILEPEAQPEPAAAVPDTEDARRSRSPLTANADPEPAAIAVDLDNEDDYQVPEDDFGFWIPGAAPVEDELPFAEVAPVLASAPAANRSLRPADTCAACLDEVSTHLFMPCAHFCCCESCLEQLVAPRCPLCNVDYESVVRVRRT